MTQTWRGHAAFRDDAGEARILIDPLLPDNPSRDNGRNACFTTRNSKQRGDR